MLNQNIVLCYPIAEKKIDISVINRNLGRNIDITFLVKAKMVSPSREVEVQWHSHENEPNVVFVLNFGFKAQIKTNKFQKLTMGIFLNHWKWLIFNSSGFYTSVLF